MTDIWRSRCDKKGQWEVNHNITEEMKRTMYHRLPSNTPPAKPYLKRKDDTLQLVTAEFKKTRLRQRDQDATIDPRKKIKMKNKV
jgi:hypothetical protein